MRLSDTVWLVWLQLQSILSLTKITTYFLSAHALKQFFSIHCLLALLSVHFPPEAYESHLLLMFTHWLLVVPAFPLKWIKHIWGTCRPPRLPSYPFSKSRYLCAITETIRILIGYSTVSIFLVGRNFAVPLRKW